MSGIVIIGGGVAGLAAACRLAELGAHPVVLESGAYPSHKVCGEFLSPECLPLLESWGILPTAYIPSATFFSREQSYQFPFPQPAGGISHLEFDPLLVEYAKKHGAEIRTHVSVSSLTAPKGRQEAHQIVLSDGEVITAKAVVIATGRLEGLQKPRKMPFMGFKAHFEGITIETGLEMYAFPGAYVGIGQIAPGKVNIAALARRSHFDSAGSPEAFVDILRRENRRFDARLKAAQPLFDRWISCQVPEFGVKQVPQWPNSYFIGDAAGTIPPACGDGLAIALASGRLAAEYALSGDDLGFRIEWKRLFASRIRWGKMFHSAMMNPMMASMLIKASQHFAPLPQFIFNHTRAM